MPTRRALVVGAGIAGLATALRLRRSDWDIVLVERAAEPQDLGFPCALRGTGHDAATRLGLMPALIERSQPRCDTVVVDVAGTPFALYSKPSTATPVLRPADVVTVLRGAIGGVEARRSTGVLGLVEDDCGVTVTFSDGDEDWFDLVVGADGVGSTVRGAVFGERQEHRQTTVSVSSRLETASASAVRMDLSGRSVRVHPLRDGGSAALFAWHGGASLALQQAFSDLAWLRPDLLSQVDAGPATRRASFRVHADRWVTRQIALVGDAAWCTGRPCGQGVSLAIGGAELLGDALDIFTGTAEALAWWEEQMRPIVRHQKQLRPFQTRRVHTGQLLVTNAVARPGEQRDEDCL